MTLMPLDPSRTALFLDVDGTLLDIVDDPATVVADPALIDSLRNVEARLAGALALISGRTIAEVDRIFSPAAFAVAGAHGTELRVPGGDVEVAVDKDLPIDLVSAIEAFASEHPGLLVEIKDSAVALHYRRAPQVESKARDLVDALLENVSADYRLIDGKMVLEIASRTHDKGAAIRRFMEHPAYSGRQPVFLGDDVTDEDGFVVVNELDGISIHIGDSDRTAAMHMLPDVESVRRWLLAPFSEQRTA